MAGSTAWAVNCDSWEVLSIFTYFFKKYIYLYILDVLIYLYILDVLLLVNTSLWWDRGNGGDCWPAPHGQTEQDLMYQEDQLGGIPVKLNKYGDIVVSKKWIKLVFMKICYSPFLNFVFFRQCSAGSNQEYASVFKTRWGSLKMRHRRENPVDRWDS